MYIHDETEHPNLFTQSQILIEIQINGLLIQFYCLHCHSLITLWWKFLN